MASTTSSSLSSWDLNLSTYAPSISNSTSKSITKSSPTSSTATTSILPPGCSAQLTKVKFSSSATCSSISPLTRLAFPSHQKLKSSTPQRTPPTPEQLASLQSAKAWELAYSPAKALPMNAGMLWMSGNSVQIFSMMVVGMMFTGPAKGVMGMNQAFAPYSTLPISTTSNAPAIQPSLWQQKTVFLLCQLLAVSLGVYKAWAMGLLPTASSDWLAWREARVVSLGLEAQENSA